ncbi:hypothetical protein HNQ91_000600 [Filimonas zeae]|nr:hypothetical protein [Filimonas zeae]
MLRAFRVANIGFLLFLPNYFTENYNSL